MKKMFKIISGILIFTSAVFLYYISSVLESAINERSTKFNDLQSRIDIMDQEFRRADQKFNFAILQYNHLTLLQGIKAPMNIVLRQNDIRLVMLKQAILTYQGLVPDSIKLEISYIDSIQKKQKNWTELNRIYIKYADSVGEKRQNYKETADKIKLEISKNENKKSQFILYSLMFNCLGLFVGIVSDLISGAESK